MEPVECECDCWCCVGILPGETRPSVHERIAELEAEVERLTLICHQFLLSQKPRENERHYIDEVDDELTASEKERVP